MKKDNHSKILLQKNIDILRDERKEINSAWRGHAKLWWAIMSALLTVALSVFAFVESRPSASEDTRLRLIAYVFCLIIFIALLGAFIYFQVWSMRYALSLFLVDSALKQITGLNIITYADLHPILGRHRIPKGKMTHAVLFLLCLCWMLMTSYLFYEILSMKYGAKFLCLLVSVVLVILVGVGAFVVYLMISKQILKLAHNRAGKL